LLVVCNTQRAPLAAPETRAALGKLIDLPRLVQVAFDGHATPHSGPYVAGTPSYDAAIAPWPYDPAAAAPILATPAAPKKLSFLATAGSTSVEQLATLMEEDLRKAGVALTIEKLDFARQLERLRAHDFDVSALQLTLAREQDNWALYHTGGEQNWGGFSDPEVDALLDRIRVTEDAGARHALDRQLHALLHARGPMSFLVAPEVDTALAPGFGGVRPSSESLGFAGVFRVAGMP
jgi:ABC-type transport system substrate-binding protein